MAIIIKDIKLPLSADEASLGVLAARALGVGAEDILSLTVKRISIDARKKNDINLLYTLRVALEPRAEERALGRCQNAERAPQEGTRELIFGREERRGRTVVVGLGPGGLFAAYMLAREGYAPLVIERGKPVGEREKDVERFWGGGKLDESSNVMFGEGGAGAFSDGKLTTRIKDGRAAEAVGILADFGAGEEIRVMAKPHIGTDRLKATVSAMRCEIERLGGEVRFSSALTGIESEDGVLTAVKLTTPSGEERIECSACVLASGQAATDTYRMLLASGVEMAQKPFAAGVRIEHPREFIDRAQFGAAADDPRLGAAEYHFADRAGDRGVYTFCMCPGGLVVAGTSAAGEVVTNGMSFHARSQENSNAAIVVEVNGRDFPEGPLGGLVFRQRLERAAFIAGGGDYLAPATTVGDLLKKRRPKAFGSVKPTYRPGVAPVSMDKVLPDFMAEGVSAGIRAFGRKLRGFDMDEAVVTAVESRTSSPVRILRGESGDSVSMRGLYPVGEGAGYAGGIVSAAVDGMKAAEHIMARFSRS